MNSSNQSVCLVYFFGMNWDFCHLLMYYAMKSFCLVNRQCTVCITGINPLSLLYSIMGATCNTITFYNLISKYLNGFEHERRTNNIYAKTDFSTTMNAEYIYQN